MKKIVIGGLISIILIISIFSSLKIYKLNREYNTLLSRYTLVEDNMISTQATNYNYKHLIKDLRKENKDLECLLAKKPSSIEVVKWKTKVVTNTVPIKDYKIEDIWIRGFFTSGMFTYTLKPHTFENVRVVNNDLITYIIWDKTVKDYAMTLTGKEKDKYINLSKVYTLDVKTNTNIRSLYLNLLIGGGLLTGDFKVGTSLQYNNLAAVGIYNCRSRDKTILVGYNLLFWR